MGPAKHAEKTRKGMGGVGWEAHATLRDPTLDAVGTRSCAIRRGTSKNVQRQYLTCPSELVPPRVSYPSLCVLRGLLCKFSLLSSVRARFESGSLKPLAKLPDL